MNLLRLGIVSFFFLGCAPLAPGTFGTLGGVALAWALRSGANYLLWLLLVCVALYLAGRALGPWAEARAGKDPGIFVLDEVIGYLVTVAWIRGPSYLTLVVGFFVFRFFDVVKPLGVRRLEQIPGADGILLDDVAAGLYGFCVLLAARLLSGNPDMWNWTAA